MDTEKLEGLKLYECRYEVVYYVMASGPQSASAYIRDVVDDDPFEVSDVHVHKFDPAIDTIDDKWQEGCLVYGLAPDGFTLGDAVQFTKSKMKDERQTEFSFMNDETISGDQNV